MSIVTTITKQPLRLIEVPLSKFSEEVIPYHQNLYEQHKSLVLKLMSKKQLPLVLQEVKNKKRVIKQLKDLMYELDTLRTQVEDWDLDKFDTKTLSFRKIIINLISGYTDLEKRSLILDANRNEEEENLLRQTHPFEGASQIQIHENLDDLKLKQRQQVLDDVENVQRDTEDLKEIFTHLNEMVEGQREAVDQVEEKIEDTQQNVQAGFKQILKAHKHVVRSSADSGRRDGGRVRTRATMPPASRVKPIDRFRSIFRLKTAVYPVTGAFLGTMIGGPVGLVAGFKIGGLTALGCAVAGYTGGVFFKKNHAAQAEAPPAPEASTEQPGDDAQEKKDI